MASSAQRIDFDEVAAPATPASAKVRLYAKSDGHLYQKDDAGTETDLTLGGGVSSLQHGKVKDTATANQNSSGTGFQDATGMSITITTGARRVLLCFVGCVDHGTNNGSVNLDFTVDGTRQGGSAGLMSTANSNSNLARNASFTYLTDVLSAGSHTFKVQFATPSGTARFYLGASGVYPTFSASEMI